MASPNVYPGFTHFAAAATQTIAGATVLGRIVVNQAATTISVYDETSAAGTSNPVALLTTQTGSFPFDVQLKNGLTVVIVGSTPDVTIVWA